MKEIEQLEKSIHELKHNARRAGFWCAIAWVSVAACVAVIIYRLIAEATK